MSVSLPPPTVPTESGAAEIRAQPPVRSLKFEQYTLELHGADVVSDALYDGIVEVSTSLSDVVRRLSAACYAAGYPACQIRYARVDNTVYVLLDTRGVDRVMGAPHIAKYFRGLEGDDSLTVHSLEPRRFLATMHADRAGTVAQPVIKDGDDGETVMDIASVESEVASKLSAEFGNPGTRFVGRYLGSFNAGIGSVWGDEITLGWREGFTQIGSNANDGDYHELNLAVSRVTPWGIFGGGAILAQLVGVLAVGAFVFPVSFVVWTALKATVGIRAEEEAEVVGLDQSELGMEAYPEFGRGSQTM